MLWVTSGVAEFWSLTIAERKKLLEVAIEEARGIDPDVIVQSCTAAIVGQGLPGADAACPGRRRRHRLHPDPDDGIAWRRRGFELLQIHRRPHRHRTGDVQLTQLGIRALRSRGRPYRRGDSRGMRHQRGVVPAASEPLPARARTGSGDLGMRYDGVPGRLAESRASSAPGSWAPRATSSRRRKSVRCRSIGIWSGTTNSSRRWTTLRSRGSTSSSSTCGAGSPAIPDARTTSPTGAARSNTPHR